MRPAVGRLASNALTTLYVPYDLCCRFEKRERKRRVGLCSSFLVCLWEQPKGGRDDWWLYNSIRITQWCDRIIWCLVKWEIRHQAFALGITSAHARFSNSSVSFPSDHRSTTSNMPIKGHNIGLEWINKNTMAKCCISVVFRVFSRRSVL